MLIRWATEEERTECGFDAEVYGEYDVLAAVDRMTNRCLGIAGFSREDSSTKKLRIFDENRKETVEERLLRCIENQIEPKGASFHYRYPSYAREAKKEHCPCCNELPMPGGMEDLAELEHSWITASPVAQGRLFGKCCVTAKYHSVMFYDMPKDIMTGFMGDVQKAANALHRVTGAVKINYEIHGNSGPHVHCHLFPRYLDDDFPSAPIDYRITEPSPYESVEEYRWFVEEMRRILDAIE